MKKTALALMMVLSLSAISCEQIEELIVPVFPESQELVFTETNSVKELTFTANTDWTLVSSAVWCQFIDQNGNESNSILGEEGECKVKIKVTEKGQQVGDEDTKDVTSITMIMKNQKKVIASVIRNGEHFEFQFLDAEGKPIALENSVIEIGYKEFLPFTVKANFPFFVKEQPKWVEFEEGTVNGSVNQMVTAKARIIGDGQIEKYPVEASEKNVISFSDREGKAIYNIKVKYAGMPEGVVEIASAGPRKDWNVSMDGVTYTQEGSSQNSEEGDVTFENELPATVKTLKDEFTLLYLDEYEEWGQKMIGCSIEENPMHPVDWMKVKNEKGSLKISVGETAEDRHGWILALPKGMEITAENWFEKLIKSEIDQEMGTMTQTLDEEIIEAYLVAELIQAKPQSEEEEEAFNIFYVDMMSGQFVDIPYVQSEDQRIISDYGIKEVYEIVQSANSINISPNLEGDWDFIAMDSKDNDVAHMIEKTDEKTVNIWFEEPLAKDDFIVLVFRTGVDFWSKLPKKILIIRPNL